MLLACSGQKGKHSRSETGILRSLLAEETACNLDFAGFSVFPDKSNSLCLDFLFNNVVYAKHLLSFWNFGRCQIEGAYIWTAFNRNLGHCISTGPYLGKEITLRLLTFHCWRKNGFCVHLLRRWREHKGAGPWTPLDTACLFYPCALNVCPFCVAAVSIIICWVLRVLLVNLWMWSSVSHLSNLNGKHMASIIKYAYSVSAIPFKYILLQVKTLKG